MDFPSTIEYVAAKDCNLHVSDKLVHLIHNLEKEPFDTILKMKVCDKFGFFTFTLATLSSDSSVGISATYAKYLGIKEGASVKITLNKAVQTVTKVFVRPASKADLQILEENQEIVEREMLSQIQIVWPGQIFVVWVLKNIHLALIVESVEPANEVGRLETLSALVVLLLPDVDVQMDKFGLIKCEKERVSEVLQQQPVVDNKMDNSVTFFNSPSAYIYSLVEKLRAGDTKADQIQEKVDFIDPKFAVYRVHPLIEVVEDISPYDIFIHQKYMPCKDNGVIFKVEPVDVNLLKASSSSVFVRVKSVEPWKTGDDVVALWFSGDEHCAFTSRSLRDTLSLNIGSRIRLSSPFREEERKIQELIISPVGNWDNENVLKVFKDYIIQKSKTQTLFLNTFGFIHLQVGDGTVRSVILQEVIPNSPYVVLNNAVACQVKITVQGNSIKRFPEKECFHPKDLIDQNCLSMIQSSSHMIEKRLEAVFSIMTLFKQTPVGQRAHGNVLIVGKQGLETFARYIVHELMSYPFFAHVEEIHCDSLKGKAGLRLFDTLETALKKCMQFQPSVLLLHNLHSVLPIVHEVMDGGVLLDLFNFRDKFISALNDCQRFKRLAVIATVPSRDDLTPGVMASNIFHTQINMPELDKENRKDMFSYSAKEVKIKLDDDVDVLKLAEKMDVFSASDIEKVAEKAAFSSWQREGVLCGEDHAHVTLTDTEIALKETKPVALCGIKLSQNLGKLTWEDVGGLDKIKELLIKMMMWPKQYPAVFAHYPLRPQTGLLLYGPPGTGKTHVAAVVASTMGLNFISIKGPELLSKYIGQSEEEVRNVFKRAQEAKPSVLFFDEFDSLAPRRGQDNTGVTDRVVNQLLTLLDGVEGLSGVWILAATSRPDMLDPALLRPGRLDRSVRLHLPNKTARFLILKALTRHYSLDKDVNLHAVARVTDGFSGADLQSVLLNAEMAQVKSLYEDKFLEEGPACFTESVEPPDGNTSLVLNQSKIMAAVKDTRPSISPKQLKIYQRQYSQFEAMYSGSRKKSQRMEMKQMVTLA